MNLAGGTYTTSSRPNIPKWIIDRLIEWKEISKNQQPSSKKLKEKGRMNIPIYAFDTETIDGYVKLIACNDGKYLLFDKIKENNVEKILKFMTRKEYYSSLNFFYYIDYDVAAIIKYLPEKNIKELLTTARTTYKDFHLSYIPHKVFTIKRFKKFWRFYDLWQYYKTSLDNAAKTYLNSEGKDPIDRERLSYDLSYWKKNLKAIIDYCIKDCKLTAMEELVDEIIKLYQGIRRVSKKIEALQDISHLSYECKILLRGIKGECMRIINMISQIEEGDKNDRKSKKNVQ